MALLIEQVLDESSLARLDAHLASAEFVDGRVSAGADAARVKRNEELARTSADALDRLVIEPLLMNPTFQAYAQPLRMTAATFARYRAGMLYGPHIDDPIMGSLAAPMRCDLAVTVFLSTPEDYEGGELLIRGAQGARTVKAARGTAFVYGADAIHEVTEVVAGERRVAVAWVQSRVRSAEQRALLHSLWCARDTLRGGLPDAAVTAEVDRVYASLTRMWSEV